VLRNPDSLDRNRILFVILEPIEANLTGRKDYTPGEYGLSGFVPRLPAGLDYDLFHRESVAPGTARGVRIHARKITQEADR
jgi:hypothetical protein